MITSDQMSAIMRSRKLQVVPVVNGGATRWIAKTADGSRAGPNRAAFSTPEEAVEAAEARFAASDTSARERDAQRMIVALERGRYFIRPREAQSTDPETGTPITIRLFSAHLPNGNPVPSVQDRSSFARAVIDMEKLLP